MAKGFNVPEDVLKISPKLPETEPTDLQATLDSPVKTLTSVKGKVAKVIHNSSLIDWYHTRTLQ